jgi:hypothetical protein
MTDELMDRVREADPLPDGSSAPPFSVVLAHARTAEAGIETPKRRGWVARTFALASVFIVVVVSVVILGTKHHNSATTHPPPKTRVSRTTLVVPKSGMSGFVYLYGAGFSSSQTGIVSLQQCTNCTRGGTAVHPRVRYWMVTTLDGGRSWTLSARAYYVQQPLFDGRYGWAGGLQAAGGGYGGIARFYESSDGGRTWNVAPSAAPNEGGAVVSLGGGEVWAVGLSNQVTIENGSVAGTHLVATATQPIHGDQTNVYVVAGGPETAFVGNSDVPRELFVTHDDGNKWLRIPKPCVDPTLLGAEGNTVWADCAASGGRIVNLAESSNGGRSWQELPTPTSASAPRLQPVSNTVVWASTIEGDVFRTADAGGTWKLLWSPAQASIPEEVRHQRVGVYPPVLVAQSSNRAEVFEFVQRGGTHGKRLRTNLVINTTTDGGATWQPQVVGLAGR